MARNAASTCSGRRTRLGWVGRRKRRPARADCEGGFDPLRDDPTTGNRVERMQWVKTGKDGEARQAMLDAVREAFEVYEGRAEITPPPEHADADLATLYPLADLHLGMYAWGKETGADYDVEIAERLLKDTLGRLFNQSPSSGLGIILGLGDFTHADDETATTRGSGNRLDVDSRHPRVLLVAAKLLIWAVEMALERHDRVVVRLLPGNHDPEVARALSICLALFFGNNDRVEIDLDPGLWWFMRWGRVFLGSTHGHNSKPLDMIGTMAQTHPVDWGKSIWRRMYYGHIHHETKFEKFGAIAESFGTLASKDAYHAGKGYGSERSIHALTFHRDLGPLGRTIISLPPGATELVGWGDDAG